MYVQHPYHYNGKYYANIDDEFIEITKEVAMAMFASYRNEIYRSRKWAPDEEHPEHPSELLDCVFRDNSDGISMEDLPDTNQMSPESLVVLQEDHAGLYQKMERLNPQERFIIKSIYFEGMSQVEVAAILGISKSHFHHKLGAILQKMRGMYQKGKNF